MVIWDSRDPNNRHPVDEYAGNRLVIKGTYEGCVQIRRLSIASLDSRKEQPLGSRGVALQSLVVPQRIQPPHCSSHLGCSSLSLSARRRQRQEKEIPLGRIIVTKRNWGFRQYEQSPGVKCNCPPGNRPTTLGGLLRTAHAWFISITCSAGAGVWAWGLPSPEACRA
jgi:hypothetical protein